MIPPLEIHQGRDPVEAKDLELTQQNTKGFVRPLEENPLLSGRYIEDVKIGHGVNTEVEHKLDRSPRGWILCDVIGDLAVIARTAWTKQTITFNCTTAGTNDVTVKLWVF